MATDNTSFERRRVPRVEVQEPLECRVEMRTRIRLIDISLSGALLASDAQLPVGTKAHLRAGVGAGPFAPEVRVQRVMSTGSRESGLGAVFLGMDDKSRLSLEAFLRKASE
jgi:hypothetical protein